MEEQIFNRWEAYIQAELQRQKELGELRKERYNKFCKNLKKGILLATAGGILLFGWYNVHSNFMDGLTPEQRRDYNVMHKERPFMEGLEYVADRNVGLGVVHSRGSYMRENLIQKARSAYEQARELCPLESDIGERCRERYQNSISNLKKLF